MPDTLAQTIRAKYPGVYDDLNDRDLEAKVLKKYPAYGDMPRTPSGPGLFERLGHIPYITETAQPVKEAATRSAERLTDPRNLERILSILPEGAQEAVRKPFYQTVGFLSGATTEAPAQFANLKDLLALAAPQSRIAGGLIGTSGVGRTIEGIKERTPAKAGMGLFETAVGALPFASRALQAVKPAVAPAARAVGRTIRATPEEAAVHLGGVAPAPQRAEQLIPDLQTILEEVRRSPYAEPRSVGLPPQLTTAAPTASAAETSARQALQAVASRRATQPLPAEFEELNRIINAPAIAQVPERAIAQEAPRSFAELEGLLAGRAGARTPAEVLPSIARPQVPVTAEATADLASQLERRLAEVPPARGIIEQVPPRAAPQAAVTPEAAGALTDELRGNLGRVGRAAEPVAAVAPPVEAAVPTAEAAAAPEGPYNLVQQLMLDAGLTPLKKSLTGKQAGEALGQLGERYGAEKAIRAATGVATRGESEAALGKTLGTFANRLSKESPFIKQALADVKAGVPGAEERFAEVFNTEKASGALDRLLTEAGGVNLQALLHLGSAGVGGAIGGTIGDTPEKRVRNAVLGAIAGAFAPSALRRPADYAISGMLSGPGTHAVNIAANVARPASEVGSTAIGELLTKAGLLKGERAFVPGETAAMVKGAAKAVPKALKAGLKLATEAGPARRARAAQLERQPNLSPYDVPRKEFEGGLLNPLNWPGRGLEAEDIAFRRIAEGARQAQIRVNPKLTRVSDDIGTFASKMVFQEDAPEIARKFIQVRENIHNAAVDSMRKGDYGKAIAAGLVDQTLQVAVPFVRVTSNIAKQAVEFSPLGAIRGALNVGGGRRSAEQLTRGLFGSTVLTATGYYLNGHLHGQGPSDPASKSAWLQQGYQPNSVDIGGFNVPLRYFGPVGSALAAYATTVDKHREAVAQRLGKPLSAESPESQDIKDWVLSVAHGASAWLTETALGDVSLLASGLQDPAQVLPVIARRFAQLGVPMSALSRVITAGIDPYQRTTSSKDVIERGLQLAQQITPGASTELPPKLDVFGRPVKQPTLGAGTPAGRLGRRLTGVGKIQPDEVIQTLLELEQQGVTNALPGFPSKRLTRNKQQLQLTPEQEQLVQQNRGQARFAEIERLLRNPQFLSLPAERQRAAFDRAATRASARANVRNRRIR